MPPMHLAVYIDSTDDENDQTLSRVRAQAGSMSSLPATRSQGSKLRASAVLCFCMLTHSYLLISAFPISGFMAMELLGVDEESAGSYAGLIASCFMIGRATTSYAWGKIADTYGRTTVIFLSLGLSCLFSVAFGLARQFYLALFIRFCLGASNGIISSVKTLVSELAEGDEKNEARAMSMVIGMWGIGFMISPAISGAIAEPMRQYPEATFLHDNKVVSRTLHRYPFLLPNLLGSVLCIASMCLMAAFVEETLPRSQLRSWSYMISDARSCCRSTEYRVLPMKDHESDKSLPDPDQELTVDESAFTMCSLLARRQTRTFLVLYWLFSFVGLTVDETFPLFCLSKVAGFGIQEAEIGKILSLCGLVFAFGQFVVSTAAYDLLGLYGSIRVGTTLASPVMFIVPFALLLNKGENEGSINRRTCAFLVLALAIYRLFAMVFFTNITVALNRSVPTSHRATMNGLSMLGGSVTKGCGPVFAGLLVTHSVKWCGGMASLLVFGTIGSLGCLVVVLTWWSLEDDDRAHASHDDLAAIEMSRNVAPTNETTLEIA